MHLVCRSVTPLLVVGLTLLAATGLDWNADLTWHDQHRVEQIGLLSVVVLGVLTLWRKDIRVAVNSLPRWGWMTFAWAFGLGLVSAISATYVRFAALEWATLLLLLGLVFLLATEARRAGALFDIWASRLIMALAVVVALKIMTGYFAAVVVMKHIDTIMLFEGTFSNRRFFGQVASMALPLLAYPLLRGGLSKRAQVALFALLAMWWMLAIVSGTRGTWIALAVAAAVLAAFAWRTCASWLRIQALAFGVGALLFAILFVWLPDWIGLDTALESRLSNFSSLNGRAELWALAWAQIQANPWLGIGPMHLAAIRNDFGAHPHNAVLQLIAEWGAPAALALILPAAVGMQRLLVRLRQQEATPNVLMVCLTASLLAACMQSMVDGVIVIPYTQTLLALVAGWSLGVYFRGTSETLVVHASSDRMHWVIQGVSFFALAALLNGVFPEALNRAEVTQSYADTGKLIPPRYWGVGWIP